MERVGIGLALLFFRWLLRWSAFLWERGEGPTTVLMSLDGNMAVLLVGGTDLPSSICGFPKGLERKRPIER